MSNSLSQNLKRIGVAVAASVAMSGAFNASAHVHEGSILEGYQGFVNKMTRPNGGMSCCHLQDGQGNLEEKIVRGEDGKQHYRVKITKDLSGKDLPKPIWVDIPDEAVLSPKYAKEFCDAVRRDTPNDPDAATCKSPPFNVLWTPSYNESGPYTVYCYIPVPRGF